MDMETFKRAFKKTRDPKEHLVGLPRHEALTLFKNSGSQTFYELARTWPSDKPFWITKKTHEELKKLAESTVA